MDSIITFAMDRPFACIVLGIGITFIGTFIEVRSRKEINRLLYGSLLAVGAIMYLVGFIAIGNRIDGIVSQEYGGTTTQWVTFGITVCVIVIEYGRKTIVKWHQEAKAESEVDKKYYNPDR